MKKLLRDLRKLVVQYVGRKYCEGAHSRSATQNQHTVYFEAGAIQRKLEYRAPVCSGRMAHTPYEAYQYLWALKHRKMDDKRGPRWWATSTLPPLSAEQVMATAHRAYVFHHTLSVLQNPI